MRLIKIHALAVVIAISLLFSLSCTQPANQTESPPEATPKAAIIDQLYSIQPNQAFIRETTDVLEAYGFQVDLYRGDEVTVDLYRQLPSYGYRLIIFRSHSGLLELKGELINKTLLFTNEAYSKTKYISEQVTDQLAMARVTERDPWVFGIGSEFITRSMDGRFDNTFIIVMGCSCIYITDLAQAFLEKGASAYLAWDASVDLNYVDEATRYLIKQLCAEGVTVREAVLSTMNVVGPDPEYKAVLKYCPEPSGGETLKELVW